jgi:excisionase family DNA binding protein
MIEVEATGIEARLPMKQFLTVAQAAELANVHVDTIRRLIHLGELPAIRVGRQWRIDASAVWAAGIPAPAEAMVPAVPVRPLAACLNTSKENA